MPPATSPESGLDRLDQLDRLWQRHSRAFWILHSIWALGTGTVVLWLAHEQYGLVPWVVGFLILTWGSTLFFARAPTGLTDDTLAARFGRGLASYVTRVLYQQTLFFLLPFYAYSVVFPSWNVIFPLLLALLAVLACLDLMFDRWLQASAAFGLVFFASVTFGALNLLLPMFFSIAPAVATPAAAVTALATAAPLAVRGRALGTGSWLRLAAAGLALLVGSMGYPQLVPPAPLRVRSVTFARGIDRASLTPVGTIDGDVDSASLPGGLVVIATVFAPSNVPARVVLDWHHDHSLVRTSREVEILAHEGGFRFWDVLRPEEGALAPGVYRITLRTADKRMFGTATVQLH